MSAALLLIALEYSAPSACPARAELWSKISQAAPDVRLVDAQGAARSYAVTVSQAGDGFRGELRDVSWPAPRTPAAIALKTPSPSRAATPAGTTTRSMQNAA